MEEKPADDQEPAADQGRPGTGQADPRDCYLGFFDDFPNPIWRAGTDAKCNYFNREWLAFTGRTLAQEMGDGWAKGVHPGDFDRCLKTYLDAFSRREPFEMEYRLRHRDGTYHWLLDCGKPFYDAGGAFAGYLGTCYDINARKTAEAALHESEKRYRDMFEINNAVMIIVDPESRQIVDANAAACRYYGYSREEMTKLLITQINTNDPEAIKKDMAHAATSPGAVFQFRHKKKNGEIRDVRVFSGSVHFGGRILLHSIIQDVTEEVRSGAALKESEKRYRELVENLSVVIVSVDREGMFTYVSPVVDRLYGYVPQAMIGQHFLQYVHPDERDHVAASFARVLSGKYEADTFRILAHDSSVRWISVFPRPIQRDGSIAGFNYVMADITDRKNAEDEERLAREHFETLAKVAGMQDATEQELAEFVMQAACRMTGSSLSFIGTMSPDESIMNVISWSASVMKDCRVPDAPLHFPIQKAGIWADAVRTHRPVIVNDYPSPHPGKKGLPPGHVKITRFLSLPVIENGKIVMVAAVANKPGPYSEADMTRLSLLMQGVWGNVRKRKADEVIRRSEALLNETGELARIGGWELDLRTNTVVMTAESYHISEIPESETLDMDLAVGYFDLPGRDLLLSAIGRCAESGEPFDLVLPFTTRTGRHIWTRSLGHAVRQDKKIVKITGTLQDITEIKKAELALLESRQLLQAVLNAITFRVFWKDTDLVFLGCNTAFARDAGYERPEDVVGKDDYSMSWREQAAGYIADDRKVIGTGTEKILFEEAQTSPAGETKYLLTSKVPLKDAGGNVIGVLGTYLDITERKKAEAVLRDFNRELEAQVKAQTEKINASLNEKVVLLREIHHRVKNNLQLIISLTNLQMRQSNDEQLIQVMKETQNRVRAMSLVHEKLYQSEDIARISLAEYTRFLATQLFAFYGSGARHVKLEIDIDRIMLDINTAIPVGLIINELVSNALKHAFPDNREGEILVRAREEGDEITLLVQDTGTGMPKGLDWKEGQTLGLRLVRILSEQLNGTVGLLPEEKGTAFFIRLKKAKSS